MIGLVHLCILVAVVYGNFNTFRPLIANRFKIVTQQLTYEDAKQNCLDLGAKLFEPMKTQENEFVVDLAKNQDVTEYWIGIHGHNLYSSNDELITWNYYDPLAKVELIDGSINEKCTLVCFFCTHMGMWKDEDCSLKRHSVCDYDTGKFSGFFSPSKHNRFEQNYISLIF